jgi:hypothetical protein
MPISSATREFLPYAGAQAAESFVVKPGTANEVGNRPDQFCVLVCACEIFVIWRSGFSSPPPIADWGFAARGLGGPPHLRSDPEPANSL